MEDLKRRLMAVSRPELLSTLAVGIHDLTIRARYYYDEPDIFARLRETNEAIHRLSGHLKDLVNADELFTDSRAEAVAGLLALLPRVLIVGELPDDVLAAIEAAGYGVEP